MSLNEQTIKKIAHLARLELTEAETTRMLSEISSILSWIDQLAKIPTDGVPLYFEKSDQIMIEQEDQITDGNRAQEVLRNTPEQSHGMYVVPKVVE